MIFDAAVMKTTSDLLYQFLYNALADTEKTYSGLTDDCAKAGRAGCKLVEYTGDGASGEDVKGLLNYAHDVTNPLPGLDNITDSFHLRWPSRCIVRDMKFPLSPAP